MKLLQIGRDKWTVYVIAGDDWSSELLDVLAIQSETDLGERMLALLREHVPTHGPPRNIQVSRDLGKGRFEFRRQPSKGAALRVLYFYDKGRVIVCSNAFWKKTDKTPPEQFERIDVAMSQYERAKKQDTIEIRPWVRPED